ncbi:MAG: CBS domain-containing protein [Polyangiaceae bacterium]|nr:CBS domain-containing protein [Polyangiaceae bacterium]
MTPSPHTIADDRPMSAAHEIMRKFGIRHLPVLRGGRIVGVVSDDDLHLIETLADVDPEKVLVSEAMTQDPYTVAPGAPLDEVVAEMGDHKYGSAVVVEGGRVIGIFTTVDACRAFAEILHARGGGAGRGPASRS